jgi:hypothetical protein
VNWDERYRREAGAISDFVVHQAIPFYNNHILPVKNVIWPDPGAIEHDVRFNMYRKIPGTPEWGMDQGARHLIRQVRDKFTKAVQKPKTESLEPKEEL